MLVERLICYLGYRLAAARSHGRGLPDIRVARQDHRPPTLNSGAVPNLLTLDPFSARLHCHGAEQSLLICQSLHLHVVMPAHRGSVTDCLNLYVDGDRRRMCERQGERETLPRNQGVLQAHEHDVVTAGREGHHLVRRDQNRRDRTHSHNAVVVDGLVSSAAAATGVLTLIKLSGWLPPISVT